MRLLKLEKSDKPDKKYMATFETDSGRTKTTHFGAVVNGKPMDDYTLTHDKEQRDRYRERHAKDLRTGDPSRAGFLSMEILWGPYTSVTKNLEAYKRKYNL